MIKKNSKLLKLRERLARYDAIPQLAFLGLLCGVSCGLLIAMFRFTIDLPLSVFLPMTPKHHVENFEGLSTELRFLLPSLGGLLLAILITYWPLMRIKVGIANLLEHMSYHQGYLSGRSLITQFFLASIALITGQSVGKEGPAIYMGSSLSSIISRTFKIPYTSHRLLLACGAAAAISAAFNTPLAGVIFAIEVILLDYTIAGFTPIIVAAVSSSLVIRLIFSSDPIFHTLSFDLLDYYEILWIVFLGAVTGCLAAIFISVMTNTKLSMSWPLKYKLCLAGLLTGVVAIFYPQVMGTGYDTISDSLDGKLDFQLLIGILLAKLFLTPVILGLGMPAGIIGPTIFIGAVSGAILGISGTYFVDFPVSDVGLYAMLGMGAMMAAVLNAPLAALIALLELTYNPNIIFPAMIAIVIANLTTRYIFKMPSAFIAATIAKDHNGKIEHLNQSLNKTYIKEIMSKSFSIVDIHNLGNFTLEKNKLWLITTSNNEIKHLFLYKEIYNYLEKTTNYSNNIHELCQHLTTLDFEKISSKETLNSALATMTNTNSDILCVYDINNQIQGIISKPYIEKHYNNTHC